MGDGDLALREMSGTFHSSLTFILFFSGRLFDFHVLDMIELGIEKYNSLSDIKVMFPFILRHFLCKFLLRCSTLVQWCHAPSQSARILVN